MPSLHVAIANMGGEVAAKDLSIYLQSEIKGSEFSAPSYQANTKGSSDIIGLLGVINSLPDLYSLASILISAYELYISPHISKNPSAGIHINLVTEDGKSASLMINAGVSQEIIVENLKATGRSITADKIHIK